MSKSVSLDRNGKKLASTPIYGVISSPLGKLTLVSSGIELIGVYQESDVHVGDKKTLGENDIDDVISSTAQQLKEYFAGERSVFDLPLAEGDTDFKRAVFEAVKAVPYGDAATYGEIAVQINKPSSAQYVAAALYANPLSIVVPCHRIVSTSSNRYVGVIESKEKLQKLETQYREKFALSDKKKSFLSRLFS